MTRTVLDAAMSIDGFWADQERRSIFPASELHDEGLIGPLIARIGAVVMSRASFDMAGDPNWFAGHYEYQVPVFVIGEPLPHGAPLENGSISFSFVPTFGEALEGARKRCAGRDVMIIGEASTAQAALASGEVDELLLRIVPRMLGRGVPLFAESAESRNFRRTSVALTHSATHIHLVARANRATGTGR